MKGNSVRVVISALMALSVGSTAQAAGLQLPASRIQPGAAPMGAAAGAIAVPKIGEAQDVSKRRVTLDKSKIRFDDGDTIGYTFTEKDAILKIYL